MGTVDLITVSSMKWDKIELHGKSARENSFYQVKPTSNYIKHSVLLFQGTRNYDVTTPITDSQYLF